MLPITNTWRLFKVIYSPATYKYTGKHSVKDACLEIS